jgi:hypothetical protein
MITTTIAMPAPTPQQPGPPDKPAPNAIFNPPFFTTAYVQPFFYVPFYNYIPLYFHSLTHSGSVV